METVTTAEFNRNPSKVSRMVRKHPVLVTYHGRPSMVVMDYDEYVLLTTPARQRDLGISAWEALRMPGGTDVEFPEIKLNIQVPDL
jgi:prevent-host-death family protein